MHEIRFEAFPFKEAERKQADKSQKMWLVRYEYHS